MVVPTTVSGNPAASAAQRPTLAACSATWSAHPMMTSSTRPGSISLRATSTARTSDARSTGCQSLSLPLRLPPAVRTASTITAVVIRGLLVSAGQVLARPRVLSAGSVGEDGIAHALDRPKPRLENVGGEIRAVVDDGAEILEPGEFLLAKTGT